MAGLGAANPASVSEQAQQGQGLAARLAEFMAGVSLDSMPADLIAHAKLLIVDVLGVALVSSQRDFADVTRTAMSGGSSPWMASIIGGYKRAPLRDAALVNGVLMHGLDFDDSYMPGIVHPTAISLPTALATGEAYARSSRDVLAAYIAGLEIACRLGVAMGGLQGSGFHATSIIGHFVSALVAGKLMGLSTAQMISAQGVAASTAGGLKVYLEDGAWSKRLHAGWAATGGISAALLAQSGFFGPTRPYEGRLGVFDTILSPTGRSPDLDRALEGLGETWLSLDIALKPYPVCHYIHGCAEAAILHFGEHGTPAEEIERVVALVPPPAMGVVCEPHEAKVAASNEYEVKFSTQHVVARCLVSGRFTLIDLTDEAIAEERVRQLAAKVVCEPDPKTRFPEFCSGGVELHTRSGAVFRHHVGVNLGAGERQMTPQNVTEKFMHAAGLAATPARARSVLAAVSDWETQELDTIVRSLRDE